MGSRQAPRSSRPPNRPARGADQAQQHYKRVGIEIARLKPRGDAVADTDRKGRAVRAEPVDRLLVTAVPEEAAEPQRRADEDAVVQLVEVPFVGDEAVDRREGPHEAVGRARTADVVVP